MAATVLTISGKVDGKVVNLNLTKEDVINGHAICDKNGVEKVIAMKKEKGAALFFINENSAANAQLRHGFNYAFDVDAKQLKEKALALKKQESSK